MTPTPTPPRPSKTSGTPSSTSGAPPFWRRWSAEYIGTAEPVGSSHVANAPGVQVSSATVRSEMVAFEREGYLVQPHTSAGRIPTDKGYRFFVDHLTTPGVLGPVQRRQVSQFFDQVHGEIETVLERATGLLSELTSYAAVVVGPSHETSTIRSVQLVGLSPLHALLVVVLSDGAVEKRTIDLDGEVSEDVLATTRRLPLRPPGGADHGGALDGARQWDADGRRPRDRGAARPSTPWAATSSPTRCSWVAPPAWPSRSKRSRRCARCWASWSSSWSWCRCCATSSTAGCRWRSATEHGFEPLSSCAVVVAPVTVDGQDLGAVGLLGPTRMDYPRTMAAAHVVGERLGERLAEGHDGRH